MGEIARLFATIGADTKGFEKGMGSAKGSLKSFASDILKNGANIVALGSALIGFGAAAAKVLDQAGKDWAAFNVEMNKGSIATGMMTEEYSRIIQAADDFRVSQSSMSTAMEMATKNGYAMSINSLGMISDTLNAIADPAARAELATEIFGRGWADIMPFMKLGSEGIKAATDAINDNILATDESVDKSNKYADATDRVEDAQTGLKNTIGNAVLPTMTKLKNAQAEGIENTNKFIAEQVAGAQAWTNASDALTDAVQRGIITEEEYDTMLGKVHQGYMDMASITTYLASKTTTLNDKQGDLLMTLFESSDSWDIFTEGAKRAGIDLGGITEELYNSEKAVTQFAEGGGNAYAYMIPKITKTSAAVEELTASYKEQAKVLKEQLSSATVNLNVQMTSFRESVTGDLVAGLEEAGLAGDEMVSRLELLDQYAGTDYAIEYQMKMEMPALLKTLIENPDDFLKEAKKFEGYFAPLTASVGAAMGEVEGLKAELAALEKTYKITIEMLIEDGAIESYTPPDKFGTVHYRTSGGGSSLQDSGISVEGERAIGGPVSGGVPYLVGERGPEIFVPESHGHIIPNSQMAGQGAGVTNIYNLSMPTTANPGDVRMAFELMEAWA